MTTVKGFKCANCGERKAISIHKPINENTICARCTRFEKMVEQLKEKEILWI